MSAPQLDPQVFQAIKDLRPVYVAYRKAKADADKLTAGLQMRDRHAALEFAGDQRSIIATRADRLKPSADALMVILAADRTLRLKFKRNPSAYQLGRALVADAKLAAERRAAAAEALKAAEAEVTAATRAAEATEQARIAITGYGS